MYLKKLRKIFRILFPIKTTGSAFFENSLNSNQIITNFNTKDSLYIIETNDQLTLIARNHGFSDYQVFKQVFNYKEYNTVLDLMIINSCFKKDKIIIDAGANVGYTSIFFSKYLENSKIYAIEPSPDNFEILSKNVALTETPQNFKIYNRALSEKPSSNFVIERGFRDEKDWAITTKESNAGNIKGITLNEIIQENSLNHVSLLKIDIEGAERFLFKKGNDLSFLEIVEIVAIEIHDEFQVRDKIYDILKHEGFLVYNVSETTIGINQKKINLGNDC